MHKYYFAKPNKVEDKKQKDPEVELEGDTLTST